jgi:DNA-binding NarL/FixJ family response regulator
MACDWPDSGKVDYTVLFYSLKENSIMARTTKPKTKPSLANLTPPPRKKRPESLTSREKEILELIWAGFKNKEIGQRLKISVKTVEAHRANMMKKMRVSNTAQLLKTAIQDGTIKIR